MKKSEGSFWGGFFAFLALFLFQSGVLNAEGTHQHDHDMQEMRMPERGQGSPVPAGTVRQDAGAQMLNKLTEKLDHEITRAGGNLGGFTNASQAHTMSQGIPLQIANEEAVTQGGDARAMFR
ncbi:MAG: hypothetical protein MPW16_12355 [Candidatus Manganitrophus sp.]|nr:MAG: hypothetical protein MPW16_12355 [Candidatus Manganitrophus sp.]